MIVIQRLFILCTYAGSKNGKMVKRVKLDSHLQLGNAISPALPERQRAGETNCSQGRSSVSLSSGPISIPHLFSCAHLHGHEEKLLPL